MNVLGIEPYYGGSHRAFIDGLVAHSGHRWQILTQPPRKWKWRMRGSGVYMARQAADLDGPVDAVFATDFLPVCDFRALAPPPAARAPLALYFHENQMTYPVQVEDARDYHYGITNITSALAADAVAFNSDYHRRTFFDAARRLLDAMPDCPVTDGLDPLESRARVLPVGFDFSTMPHRDRPDFHDPPRIVWNQRWEHDKNPEGLFDVLYRLADAGIDYRLVVLGERFRSAPPVFDEARKRLADRIDHVGYVGDREEYLRWLAGCDIVVSTAWHEFFGMSVVEAIRAGCTPLLPDRLTYPELLGESYNHYLYTDEDDLFDRLRSMLCGERPADADALARSMDRFDWRMLAPRYDAFLSSSIGS